MSKSWFWGNCSPLLCQKMCAPSKEWSAQPWDDKVHERISGTWAHGRSHRTIRSEAWILLLRSGSAETRSELSFNDVQCIQRFNRNNSNWHSNSDDTWSSSRLTSQKCIARSSPFQKIATTRRSTSACKRIRIQRSSLPYENNSQWTLSRCLFTTE